MKKWFACLSICMIINPLLFVDTMAETTYQNKHHKKHHKKNKHHHAANHVKKNDKNDPTYTSNNNPPNEKKNESETENGKEAEKASGNEKPKTWLDNVSGTFDLTTNYMFRGISQSRNLPAVQGGLTYTFPIGFYLNVWGSNVNFEAPRGETATVEIDTIGGYRGSIGENFSYDINIDRYNYAGARSNNYNELNTLWTYRFFTLGYSYSGNYSGTHATSQYINGTISLGIPSKYVLGVEDLNFQAEMGHYSFARAAGLSYNDYSLALNKKLNTTYTVTAQWTGTNGRAKQSPEDDNQLLATVTANF